MSDKKGMKVKRLINNINKCVEKMSFTKENCQILFWKMFFKFIGLTVIKCQRMFSIYKL